jgi:RNA polymerase sigma-70 factor, ECF subfamily
MGSSQAEIEQPIRAHCDGGDYRSATTALLEAYGPQILGFLKSRLHQEAAADEVFSMFCEDVWRGIPSFAWRCSARTWVYTIARHAELRYRAAPDRRPARNLPLSSVPELVQVADRVRTTTLPHLRSETKDRFRALRGRLTEEEQTILVLRVDKGMAWTDIACVLRDGQPTDEPPDPREPARLRKRFQLVKEKLQGWAEAEGLLSGGHSVSSV